MKILKFFLYLIGGIALFLALASFFAKQSYHVERSIDIKAPKSIIGEQVSNFKNFAKWSPWQELDPNMTTSFEGTDGAIGSVYKWSGNDAVGKGEQTLKGISPDRVDIEVKFTEPWESVSPTFVKMEEKDGITKTSWGFDMTIPRPWNAFAMFTDVTKAVGADYEKGLVNLKKLCEGLAAKPKYGGYEVTEQDLPTRYYSAIRKVVAFADMGKFFGENMPKVAEITTKSGAQIAGPATGLFWNYDEAKGTSDCAAAMPLAKQQKLGNGVTVFTVNAGKAAVIDYYGPYEKTGSAHQGMDEYMRAKGLKHTYPVIEEYVTDPMMEKDTAKWLTKVIYMVEPMPIVPVSSAPNK